MNAARRSASWSSRQVPKGPRNSNGCRFTTPSVVPHSGDFLMKTRHWLMFASIVGLAAVASSIPAACCYFSAKNADILQPAQKAFLTWDPAEKIETFTVQPKFEGNALDFGMV